MTRLSRRSVFAARPTGGRAGLRTLPDERYPTGYAAERDAVAAGTVASRCASGRAPWSCDVRARPTAARHPVRALAYPRWSASPQRATRVLLNTRRCSRPGHRRLRVRRRPPRPPPARTRRPGPGHLVKARYTPLQAMVLGVDEQESPAPRAAARRPTTWPACRSWSPTCTRRCRPCVAGVRARAPGRPGRLRDDRRRGAAGWFSRTVAGLREAGWLAATRDGRAGVRRRPRGGDGAHRPAGRAAGGGRRRRRGRPGAGQPRHRHPLGLLRGGRRRGAQRGRRAGRPPVGVAAGLGGGRRGAAPRGLAPQPDRLRAGRAGAGGRGGAAAARRVGARVRAQAAELVPAPRGRGTGWSRCRSTGWTTRCARSRCGCRRWAAGWTRTPRPFLAAGGRRRAHDGRPA